MAVISSHDMGWIQNDCVKPLFNAHHHFLLGQVFGTHVIGALLQRVGWGFLGDDTMLYPEYGETGSVDKATTTGCQGCLDHVTGSGHVNAGLVGILSSPLVGGGGDVKDGVRAGFHGCCQGFRVQDIPRYHVNLFMLQVVYIRGRPAQCGNGPAGFHQLFGQVAAQETGCAGDAGMWHGSSLFIFLLNQ